jgi:hypothetical protein
MTADTFMLDDGMDIGTVAETRGVGSLSDS